jgi:hypothetical protein
VWEKAPDIVVLNVKIWMMSETMRKRLGTTCLVIASFLNPFGYDLLVFKLNQLTKNYWTTMHILYAAAAFFFILFFCCYRINPVKHLQRQTQKITQHFKFRKNGQI